MRELKYQELRTDGVQFRGLYLVLARRWNQFFQHIVLDSAVFISVICPWLMHYEMVIIIVSSPLQIDILHEFCPHVEKNRYLVLKKRIFARAVYVPTFMKSYPLVHNVT